MEIDHEWRRFRAVVLGWNVQIVATAGGANHDGLLALGGFCPTGGTRCGSAAGGATAARSAGGAPVGNAARAGGATAACSAGGAPAGNAARACSVAGAAAAASG